jgi:Ferritin-like
MSRTVSSSAQILRDPKNKALDASALYAIAQAAVNVELFTIPLYMGTLYSIQGMHKIAAKGESFFKGRLWPGAATSANPSTANEKAFNIIFSVFIQEMLHLQLAANICGAIGVDPHFTSPALQNDNHGWTCYGPDKTVIPHIVDLRDMDAPYNTAKVNIAGLTKEQMNLFLAIEQDDADARKHLGKNKDKYFPSVPFANWPPSAKTNPGEQDLPMFGTIGQLYQCYYDYLNLRYTDGTSLWQYVTVSSRQRDLFNVQTGSHPEREYPHFEASLSSLSVVADMMDAITDQGEGSTLKKSPQLLAAVQEKYRSSDDALKADYPSHTDAGGPAPSADAAARYGNDGKDHYERFQEVLALLDQGKIVTWADWFNAGNKARRVWTKEDLQAPDYDPKANPNLPSTEAIAQALNKLALDKKDNHCKISRVAAGAIAGVTTVLNEYWKSQDPKKPVAFPSPSMGGTGDRMAICWALFGEAPDLSLGIDPITPDKLYHACQALDFSAAGNSCAEPAVFHTCIGSNKCKAQGGCGFVQKTSGGGNCGHNMGTRGPLSAGAQGGGVPDFTLYSAPSDNKCGTFGGCAVPISASQVYPHGGKMQLFDYTGPNNDFKPIGTMDYAKGDVVHDVAYRAYLHVMQHRGQKPPATPPPPADIRLAFPPST